MLKDNINKEVFNIECKIFQREMSKNMSLEEIGMIATLAMNLDDDSNMVKIDDKLPSIKDIGDLFKLEYAETKKILLSLEEKGIILIKNNNSKKKIYINPFWCFSGADIYE